MDFTSTYIGILIALIATGFGFPVPEEIILVLAGAAAYQGLFEPRVLVVVAIAGVLLGDLWIYFVGRYWGRKLLRRRFIRYFLPPARMRKARERFGGHSTWAIATVRFLPGLRAPTYFTAGLLKLPVAGFAATDAAISCLFVPLYAAVGYIFSRHVERIVVWLQRADRWIAVTVTFAIILVAVYAGYQIGLHRKARIARREELLKKRAAKAGPEGENGGF